MGIVDDIDDKSSSEHSSDDELLPEDVALAEQKPSTETLSVTPTMTLYQLQLKQQQDARSRKKATRKELEAVKKIERDEESASLPKLFPISSCARGDPLPTHLWPRLLDGSAGMTVDPIVLALSILHLHLRQRRAMLQAVRLNQLWCATDSHLTGMLHRGKWLELVQGLASDNGVALDLRDAELRWLTAVQGSGGASTGGMHFTSFVIELLKYVSDGVLKI